MVRHLFEFLCACALGALFLVGCSEPVEPGDDGGTDICEEVQCEDQNDCTQDLCDSTDPRVCIFINEIEDVPCDGDRVCDGAGKCVACNRDEQCEREGPNECRTPMCDSEKGVCDERAPVADGTPCSGGTCLAGVCELAGSVLPCTEQGIRNAIAAGGGPYTFDCDGPTTVTTAAEIVIDNDVILDGEGNLIVDGGEITMPCSRCRRGVAATLHRMKIQRGYNSKGNGAGIETAGTLTLNEVTVSSNTARHVGCFLGGYGGGIHNTGALTLYNSTVSHNHAEASYCFWDDTTKGGWGGGIDNRGTLALANSTVSGNTAQLAAGGIHNSGTLAR
jgi:hypothetical protein